MKKIFFIIEPMITGIKESERQNKQKNQIKTTSIN